MVRRLKSQGVRLATGQSPHYPAPLWLTKCKRPVWPTREAARGGDEPNVLFNSHDPAYACFSLVEKLP